MAGYTIAAYTGFGIQTKQDSSVFLIICILSKLGKKVRPLTLLKFVFFCRNGVMKDASPAILSSLSVVDGIAVPGFTRYLILQYQALQGDVFYIYIKGCWGSVGKNSFKAKINANFLTWYPCAE